MYLQNAVHHFNTVTKHRTLVMLSCFRCGLIYQGLTHDLSKFSPVEFLAGVRYYQGTRSPNVAQRAKRGYSAAWMHHKGRNKHHYEFWYDNSDATLTLEPVEMPKRYVAEMFCDRMSASKTYKGDAYTDDVSLQYFDSHDYRVSMNENTRALLRSLLCKLAEDGEEETFKYIRKMLRKDKRERALRFIKEILTNDN